jgi:alpha-tubulin suppressor-like RCC1 family protein
MPDSQLRHRSRLSRAGLITALATVLLLAGATAAQAVPLPTADLGPSWLQVAVGWEHTCAVRADHTLWCWGDEQGVGALPGGRTSMPVQIGTAADWAQVSAAPDPGQFNCAVRTDHTLWCWGANRYGQLGITAQRFAVNIPTQVGRRATWAQVSAGNQHACAIRTDHSLWCWGANFYGELGIGSADGHDEQDSPIRVGTKYDWTQVAAGFRYNCAIRAGQTLWCWGNDADGETGTGAVARKVTVPTRVPGSGWTDVSLRHSATCAVKAAHGLWCWGDNSASQLGLGSTGGTKDIPVRVGNSDRWAQVSAGTGYACAIGTDASLTCWGSGGEGQLGTGTPSADTPTPTATGNQWQQIVAGDRHTCAIADDGQMWCWGYNGYGELGTGDTRHHPFPVPVI